MSISPKRVANQVFLRMRHLEEGAQAEIETAYTTSGFTTVDGKQVPVSALKDAVVAMEAEIAGMIANDRNHPFRAALYGRSADLLTGSLIPSTDSSLTEVEFIGQFSGVVESATNLPLKESDLDEINRFNRKSTDRYTTVVRKFKLFSGRIYHTVANAYIEGCVFSRTEAINRLENSSSDLSPLPVQCEGLWIAKTLEFMAQEGWFVPEAQFYGSFADKAEARLKRRETQLPTLPTNDSSAEPVRN